MKNLLAVQGQIKSGELRVTDVAEEHISLIKEKNPAINAIIHFDEEKVRAEAGIIQNKVDAGTAGPLAGAVVAIKEAFSEKGKKLTCSSNALRNFESIYDATVVRKLKEADALLIGRTNMDEFAMGSSTENSIHGATRNPVNQEYVAGGSSGGSAAAVAAGMSHAALGSDTGGSIRQPASYCGVVGVKPSYSRVSRYGLVAYASSFDSVGPIAGSVTDAALLLNTLAGHDPLDNSSSQRPVEDYTAGLEDREVNLTIGVPEEYFGEGLDPEIRSSIESQLSQLEQEGAKLLPVSLPHTKYSIAAYYILATAEASSNLARYDGVRYGHRADFKEVEKELGAERERVKQALKGKSHAEVEAAFAELDSPLIRLYKKSRTEAFGKEVKRRILLGTYVLSAGYYDAYFGKAQKVRRLIQQDFEKVFSQVDVIVTPTTPTTAFKIGEKVNDPVQMYLNDMYTTSANLAGICGINVPAGIHPNGLPYGIHFMGNAFHEKDILRAGRRVELLQG
ncbi:MAG TPA: amidase family protein [Balneolaceae bacterium]|nr:amidase family protein [Balneolaceae bacterium]